MSFRIETDLLGDKELPKNACYGIQTARALENLELELEFPRFSGRLWA
jgi:aspartate ammonia-lyase